MEYAQYGDLRKYLTALEGPLPVEQGRLFLRQTLEALDFVHATGVIHRDMKPDNILVVNEKEIRLADFGMALLPGDDIDLEELKKGAGSFSYLPPELIEGIRYDSRSDIYGLGLCFYEALAGFHPFDKLPLADQLEARRDDRIPSLHQINPAIPEGLSNVIAKMMRFDSAQRFGSAAQALRALSDPDFVDSAPSGPAPDIFSSEPLWDEMDDFDIIPNAHAANQDSMEVSAQSLVDDALLEAADDSRSPLDNDPIDSRDRAYTEEMDLERIKSLVDQDVQAKARAAARQPTTQPSAEISEEEQNYSYPNTKHQEEFPMPGSMQSQANPNSTAKSRAGSVIRVAFGAALATVLLGAVYSRFFAGDEHEMSQDGETEQSSESTTSDSSNNPQPAGAPEKDTFFFPRLGRGLYAGTISDVLPGSVNPLSLISMPARNSLVVVIGLPGWTPIEIPVPETKVPGGETIAVRSNGIILNITGELSGDTITGTFTNAVTGETGTWSAKLVK
jgi:serine/threonine protein kinase